MKEPFYQNLSIWKDPFLRRAAESRFPGLDVTTLRHLTDLEQKLPGCYICRIAWSDTIWVFMPNSDREDKISPRFLAEEFDLQRSQLEAICAEAVALSDGYYKFEDITDQGEEFTGYEIGFIVIDLLAGVVDSLRTETLDWWKASQLETLKNLMKMYYCK